MGGFGVHIACGKHVDENGMFIKVDPSKQDGFGYCESHKLHYDNVYGCWKCRGNVIPEAYKPIKEISVKRKDYKTSTSSHIIEYPCDKSKDGRHSFIQDGTGYRYCRYCSKCDEEIKNSPEQDGTDDSKVYHEDQGTSKEKEPTESNHPHIGISCGCEVCTSIDYLEKKGYTVVMNNELKRLFRSLEGQKIDYNIIM